MGFYIVLVATIGFALAIAAIAGAFGQSRAIAAALEGIARQPEAAGDIRTSMIIGLALIESLVIYVLVISIMLYIKLPGGLEDIVKLTSAK
jgi:F-type H+-transporting ATPase subunit c